eukprot:TRINITY_DN81894_c0_g1_i1.p1 TRINITY_DN81894_c0_g1~~TRINITY_DN81894_c0_g1_i1.p1  ORF type:complete len:203 (+),score=24.68 TRINITY_DN81894_c0_g1_i1:134-742(+)
MGKRGGGKERNNWAAGWEPNPILPATPRWTFGKSLLNTVNFGSRGKGAIGGTEGNRRKVAHRSRETFIDEHLRAEEDQGTGENMGPGSHNPLPVDRVFQMPVEAIHGKGAVQRRNTGAGGAMQLTRRLANLSSLRQYRRTELPTCAHTPGPGSYSQFTTFGAASGPTRTSYVPEAAAEARRAFADSGRVKASPASSRMTSVT